MAPESINNSLSRIRWIIDQRQKVTSPSKGLGQQVWTSKGRNKLGADMFWGWLLIKAGCTSGPHGWPSGCSHMTRATRRLDFQGEMTLQGRSRQRACFWSSKFGFFPRQHLAVCFSYFRKLKPFWWLDPAMTHHRQDLCCCVVNGEVQEGHLGWSWCLQSYLAWLLPNALQRKQEHESLSCQYSH